MILLDTHTLIWMDRDDGLLGTQSRAAIARAWGADGVAVSAISFWEATMLARRGRISLPTAPAAWRMEILNAGVRELPLDGRIAVAATELENPPRDPADRFIVASAQLHQATLITADETLLAWPDNLRCHDARH